MEQQSTNRIFKNKKIIIIVMAVMLVTAIGIGINGAIPMIKYNTAIGLMDEERYEEAIDIFTELGDYADSVEFIKACKEAIVDRPYKTALRLLAQKKYREAYDIFQNINGYKDSEDYLGCFYSLPERVDHTTDDTVVSVADYTYEFNEQGVLVKETKESTDHNGNTSREISYQMEFDQNRVLSVDIDGNGATSPYIRLYRRIFGYEGGRITTLKYGYVDKEESQYSTTYYEYHPNGRLKSVKDIDETSIYDENGNLIFHEWIEKPRSITHNYQYSYDQNGNKVELVHTQKNFEGKVVSNNVLKWEYVYDSGKLIKEICTSHYLINDITNIDERIFEYDGDKLIKETYTTYYENNSRKINYEYMYTYDDNGLLASSEKREYNAYNNYNAIITTYERDQKGRITKAKILDYYSLTYSVSRTTIILYNYSQDGETADVTYQYFSDQAATMTKCYGERMYFDQIAFNCLKELNLDIRKQPK